MSRGKGTVMYYHKEGDNIPPPVVGQTTKIRAQLHYSPNVADHELHETTRVIAVGPNGQFETEKTIYLPLGKSSYNPAEGAQ